MFWTAHTMAGWIALGMSCQKQGAPSFRDMIEKVVVKELQLHNGGFESVKSWSFEKGRIESNPFFSPVDGLQYAALPAGASLSQTLTGSSNPQDIYTVTVYARSINEQGNDAHSEIAVSVRSGDRVLKSVSVDLSASRLRGAAGKYYSDDGANVWVDKGVRHQFNDRHFYQPVRLNPLTDPWKVYEDTAYYDEEPYLGFALGAVAFDNKRYLYGTVYSDDDEEVPYSSIRLSKGRAEGSQYEWTSSEIVLENSACSRALDQEGEMYSNCEFPWVIDAHSYFDASEQRLWLSWGGGGVWVTELDPQTGHILGKPESKEVLEHSPQTHTKVISFDGDEYSSRWVEGAALWKQGSFWYLFASYGALNRDYTI
ncbi:MAG: hypothetical protein VX278_03760, partial [Myxococcota bacterium]|nr:hypothetical protein [Myxococcota bacterium]